MHRTRRRTRRSRRRFRAHFSTHAADYGALRRISARIAALHVQECAEAAMDAIDRAILTHLHDDGRLANAELAERVRLSPSATLRRVRNLEKAGAITGYHAEIEPKAVGRGFEITVHATLIMRNRESIETFEAAVVE